MVGIYYGYLNAIAYNIVKYYVLFKTGDNIYIKNLTVNKNNIYADQISLTKNKYGVDLIFFSPKINYSLSFFNKNNFIKLNSISIFDTNISLVNNQNNVKYNSTLPQPSLT
ncbi:MAG TPA: hypothetical protein QKA14_00510, partial [Candidatus Megaira endosymbiont of Hartmannula sinica]|nr:hypothetical protein [Candidatus Megaera endosymbiont of Hartmannula sinica]